MGGSSPLDFPAQQDDGPPVDFGGRMGRVHRHCLFWIVCQGISIVKLGLAGAAAAVLAYHLFLLKSCWWRESSAFHSTLSWLVRSTQFEAHLSSPRGSPGSVSLSSCRGLA